MAGEHVTQDGGGGALDILGGGQEHERLSFCRLFSQIGERLLGRRLGELPAIALRESSEALGNVRIPLAQLGAGTDVLAPLLEWRAVPGDSPGPESIDEH